MAARPIGRRPNLPSPVRTTSRGNGGGRSLFSLLGNSGRLYSNSRGGVPGETVRDNPKTTEAGEQNPLLLLLQLLLGGRGRG